MRLNQSRVTRFLDCQQLYAWEFEEGLVAKHTPIPLLTGGALHKGLEVLRSGKEKPLKAAMQALENHYRVIVEEENKLQVYDPVELGEMEIQILWGKMMLHRFVSQFPNPEWQVLQPEVKGEAQLGDTDHVLVFTVDGLMQYLGRIWIGEYKTKNRVTAPYLRSYDMAKQI
ncbi:unnamed protein product, partial [marine sediment metagenome]